MKTLIFSAKDFEIPYLKKANDGKHQFTFTKDRLTNDTAMQALNHKAISIFSADEASTMVLEKLADFGVEHISLRSAGYDNVNLKTAKELGIKVANAPDYSPNAIAEHAIALALALNRNIIGAHHQVNAYDFRLDQLIGFDFKGKTMGVVGTGRIGAIIVKILSAFDTQILAVDTNPDSELKKRYLVDYRSLDEVCQQADVLFLSVPLNSETHYLFDENRLRDLKANSLMINVARGAVVKTEAILDALDQDQLSGYAADVYEHEKEIFFYDRSKNRPKDDLLDRLINHPKVLLTPHQAWATQDAIQRIAEITIDNLDHWERGEAAASELV
ncbi:NAD(P)-dependent oxidoreductase [Croceiramulus getboli]|nr:NAD(P)-dependent oxidoreductase [Flavobacteriaceae bacterium YJPT1-3]